MTITVNLALFWAVIAMQPQPGGERSVMVQPEMSGSEQKAQALRDCIHGEDDDRRRLGRAAEVNANLVPLLRGKTEATLLESDELDLPYGLEHMGTMFTITVSVIVTILLLGVLGLVAWAMRR